MRLIAGMVLLALVPLRGMAADDVDNSIGRFEIVRFDVEGNTLLPASVVTGLLAPFVGGERDFGDVQRALEALEAAYHRHGFNLIQVMLPEQELNQGVVRLVVIETRIGKVMVEGNRFFDQANIRRSLPGLQEGAIPNIREVSASLKMANESPAKKVNLQLQSGEQDNEVNALLKVEEGLPWKIGANVDNSGNASSGKSHVSLMYQNANVGGWDHIMSLQYTTTLEKPNQVSIYGAGYHIPLYAWSDSIDLFGSYSNVDSGLVSAGVFDLQVSGKGAVYGARYNFNFKRAGNYDAKLIAEVGYRAYQNNVLLAATQLGNEVTVHPLSIGYAGNWVLSKGEASFYVTGLRNIPGGRHGSAADFNAVRSGAPAGYTLMRYGAGFSRSLPKDWQLRVNLSGQYTRDSLIPGEQFGAGGGSSVRGFSERDVSNDVGNFASIELITPNLCAGIKSRAVQCRALGFYDSAAVSRNHPLPGELQETSIGSVGIGWRMALDKYVTLQMDYGYVLDAGGSQTKGDKRLHFMMGLSF